MRENLRFIILSFLSLILYGMIRLNGSIEYNSYFILFQSILFFSWIVYWILSVQKRINHKELRFYLLSTSSLLIFYLLVQRIKYSVVINPLVSRYLWYMYYIPMLLIPLFGYYAASFIGEDSQYTLKKKDYVYGGISIFLILAVLTNEFHQKVFVLHFQNGAWTDDYSYGFLYFTIAAWMVFLVISMLIMLYKKCSIHNSRKKVWFPISFMILGFIYTCLFVLVPHTLFEDLLPLPTTFSWLCIMVWESCIQVGLFPSNTMHEEVFEASTIAAQITDDEYNTVYSSIHAQSVSKELVHQSEDYEMILENNIRMKNQKIHNGHFLWFEDVSYMNSLLRQSKKLQSQLSEDYDLLKAEVTLRAREEKVKVQNAIYNQITEELSNQIDYLSDILETMDEEEALQKACVIGAYIKRKANLILLGHSNPYIDASEIELCFRESLNYMKTIGIEKGFISKCTDKIHVDHAKKIYDFFEDVIEESLDDIDTIFVNLMLDESTVILKIVMDGNIPFFKMDSTLYQSKDMHVDIHIKKEDSIYISFVGEIGGENHD